MRQDGKGVEFERIRRITGYLGTLDRFNDAKRAEESDRVMHGGIQSDNDTDAGGTESALLEHEIL